MTTDRSLQLARADTSEPGPLDIPHQELLAAIVESSQDAIISKNLDSVVTSWNRSAQTVFGYSADDMIGQSVMILIPEERHDEERTIIERITRGERIEHFETQRRHKDGHLIHVSLTISPIRNHAGRVIGASKIARDISDRYRHEETQRILLREVNHRSKNLLAIVEAMVRKTASTTPPTELVGRISQRLQALSAIQNLLIYADWRGVDMRTLANTQTGPYAEGRIEMEGPAVVLQPPAAQALGLAFHELATNASRHGALGVHGGMVSVRWQVEEKDGAKSLSVVWKERSGPQVGVPGETSFGTTILKRATEDALDGTVSIDYAPDGLQWKLTAPASIALV